MIHFAHRWKVIDTRTGPALSSTYPKLENGQMVFKAMHLVWEHVVCQTCGREKVRQQFEVRDFAPDRPVTEERPL